jgi:hypothetical protein
VIFCDTSYLARLYLDDAGCGEVRALCSGHEVAAAPFFGLRGINVIGQAPARPPPG